MYQTKVDMKFGVRMMDDKQLLMLTTNPTKVPLFFEGILVIVSDFCVRNVVKRKKWKRLNRPPKIKVRSYTVPGMFIAKPPMVDRPTIFCHSKAVCELEKLREVC